MQSLEGFGFINLRQLVSVFHALMGLKKTDKSDPREEKEDAVIITGKVCMIDPFR